MIFSFEGVYYSIEQRKRKHYNKGVLIMHITPTAIRIFKLHKSLSKLMGAELASQICEALYIDNEGTIHCGHLRPPVNLLVASLLA